MKYIVFDGFMDEEIYLFPGWIEHQSFAQSIGAVKRGDVISAGFISTDFKCFGKSISLNVKSRGDQDTQLLDRMIGNETID